MSAALRRESFPAHGALRQKFADAAAGTYMVKLAYVIQYPDALNRFAHRQSLSSAPGKVDNQHTLARVSVDTRCAYLQTTDTSSEYPNG